MVGGDAEAFEAARPVFEVLGQDDRARRAERAGQTVKAANQLVVGGIYALVAEAIVLLEASGVDPGSGLRRARPAGSPAAGSSSSSGESMVARIRARLPDRPAPQGHGIALAAAREAGVALPLTG